MTSFRRIVVATFTVAIVVALWRGWIDNWVDAWSAWLAGEPMSGISLGGRNMRFWERFGKLCIFMSGLSILLDITDPDTLRQRGRNARHAIDRARARASAYRAEKVTLTKFEEREARALQNMRSGIRESIVYMQPQPGPHGGYTTWYPALRGAEQRSERIADLVTEHRRRVDETDLRRFHESVLRQGFDGCTASSRCLSPDHRDRRGVCRPCKDHVWNVANRYVDNILSDKDRAWVDRWQELLNRTDRVSGWVASVWILVSTLLWFVALIYLDRWDQSEPDQPPSVGDVLLMAVLMGVYLALLGISSLLYMPASRRYYIALSLEIKSLATVPLMACNAALAVVLDKAKPGHVFRWIALTLFIVGSHFDLLST